MVIFNSYVKLPEGKHMKFLTGSTNFFFRMFQATNQRWAMDFIDAKATTSPRVASASDFFTASSGLTEKAAHEESVKPQSEKSGIPDLLKMTCLIRFHWFFYRQICRVHWIPSLTICGIVTGTIFFFCGPGIFQRNYCYYKTCFFKPSIHKIFTTNEGSTPKSSICVGVFLINPPFWEPPFSGNPHLMIFWMIFQGIGLRLPVKKKKPKEGNKSPVTRSWPCFGLW